MIILDEEDQRKHFNDPYTRGLTLRYPEKAAARSDSPLPDYETSEARQKLTAKEHYEHRKVDPRLWRAVCIALGIYVLLSIIIGIPIVVVKRNQALTNAGQDLGLRPVWDSGSDPGVTLNLANTHFWVLEDKTRCDWELVQTQSSHPLTSNVTRIIDYSGSFYIRSNITGTTHTSNYSTGHLTVDINPDPDMLDTVLRVEVTASSKELLHHTKACFDNSGTDIGLLLSASRRLQNTDFLAIGIQVLLPKNGLRERRNFVTSLPWFSHTFGDLAPYTTFNSVIVEGAGLQITAKSLMASKIYMSNAYGSVLGSYHVTDALTLGSIKGTVTANVTLERDLGNSNPTYLTLTTGDGSIDALVTLVDSAPRNLTGSISPYTFIAEVETFNAPLNLTVVHAPSTLPVPFQLNVKNNNGRTSVVLDKNYQGSFYAGSKLDLVNIRQVTVPSSSDPSGMGRSRLIEYELETPTFTRGWVGWGLPTNDMVESQVKISSSLSLVTLQL